MFQVPDPTIQWPTGGNSNDSSTTSRGWDNDLAETATTDCPEQTVAWAMSVLRQWATDSNIAVSVDELPQLTKEQITSLLSRFVIEVRQPDGGTYEPSRLRLLLGGVQAYMAVREVDELSAEPFAAVRRLVESQLHSALGVTRTRRPSPAALTREQEELLWQCGSLGDYNGTVLLHTLVYLNSRNFLIGCGHHHRRLRYVDPQITLHEPDDGLAYLQYVADGHGGGRAKVVHADPANPGRCHVNIYRKYVEKCPHEGRDPFAFYVAPKRVRDNVTWFSLVPVGHNGLQVIVPELLKRAQSEQVAMAVDVKLNTLSPVTNT